MEGVASEFPSLGLDQHTPFTSSLLNALPPDRLLRGDSPAGGHYSVILLLQIHLPLPQLSHMWARLAFALKKKKKKVPLSPISMKK